MSHHLEGSSSSDGLFSLAFAWKFSSLFDYRRLSYFHLFPARLCVDCEAEVEEIMVMVDESVLGLFDLSNDFVGSEVGDETVSNHRD